MLFLLFTPLPSLTLFIIIICIMNSTHIFIPSKVYYLKYNFKYIINCTNLKVFLYLKISFKLYNLKYIVIRRYYEFYNLIKKKTKNLNIYLESYGMCKKNV